MKVSDKIRYKINVNGSFRGVCEKGHWNLHFSLQKFSFGKKLQNIQYFLDHFGILIEYKFKSWTMLIR